MTAVRGPIRWPRLIAALVLALITPAAFRSEYGRLPLLGDVDLAIHETGHILFQPFGETMMLLAGSLFQVAFPLIFAGYFLRRREDGHRDLFSALICVWWSALNLLDVSVYIGDARAGQLMMLSGETGEDGAPHDWRVLLGERGLLARDTVYASVTRRIAGIVAMGSLAVAVISELRGAPLPPPDPADAEREPGGA